MDLILSDLPLKGLLEKPKRKRPETMTSPNSRNASSLGKGPYDAFIAGSGKEDPGDSEPSSTDPVVVQSSEENDSTSLHGLNNSNLDAADGEASSVAAVPERPKLTVRLSLGKNENERKLNDAVLAVKADRKKDQDEITDLGKRLKDAEKQVRLSEKRRKEAEREQRNLKEQLGTSNAEKKCLGRDNANLDAELKRIRQAAQTITENMSEMTEAENGPRGRLMDDLRKALG